MDPRSDLPSRFALAIFRLNGLLMENGEAITRELGQSSARWQVLGRIGVAAQTVAQMAREIGQARQSVQRIADLLVAGGLARFTEHPGDRRTKLLAITPEGLSVLGAIYEKNDQWSRRVQGRLDLQVLAGVVQELHRIGQIFEEESRWKQPLQQSSSRKRQKADGPT